MNENSKEKQNNIQVAIRVRPLISRESQNEEVWTVKNSKTISRKNFGSEKFHYDRVFDGAESNLEVYNDLCRPIVKKVVEGFNATIFAYGQTSSGKTFTMMGEHNGIKKGVIHYAITEIFETIQNMPDREFLLRVSVVEIYNEKVYDLLSEKNDDLKLMEDCYGVLNVSGLEERIVQTSDQIWDLMLEGQTKRRTGETQMNRVSSRSHFIFRMILESSLKDEEDPIVNVSQLNLVDLAGSENVKQTKSKGVRFKEGIHINLSLSTLSHVISQLSERPDQFINYRSSKLTRLLQNSLGGNSHTAIICTVTPTSLQETLSTLKFASTAKKIKNKPEKNEVLTDQALLKQYATKIKKLSEELKTTKQQGEMELEEKKKQNETLKKQIEKLKANFVCQTSETKVKAVRRETWGGHLDRRRFLDFRKPPYPQGSNKLPYINEEECENELDLPDMESVKHRNSRGTSRLSNSSLPSTCMSKNIHKNIGVQTNNDCFEEFADIDELMTMVSDLKIQLTALQNEYDEHLEYTTYEKQILKAEHELQVENEALKAENAILKRKLLLERSHVTSFNESKELESSLYKSDVFESPNNEQSNKVIEDKYTQVTPIKSIECSTEYCRNEAINEHSVQTSPVRDLISFYEHNNNMEDRYTQVTPIKSTECCRNEVTNEHSEQTSPVRDLISFDEPKKLEYSFHKSAVLESNNNEPHKNVMKDHCTQVTPIKLIEFSTQYCRNVVTNEHSVQTSPKRYLKSFSVKNLKVDQYSQVTDSFVEETNTRVKERKSSEQFHQSLQTSAAFPGDSAKERDCKSSEIFNDNSLNELKEAEFCECGYFSDEIKILVKKVSDLRHYACNTLKKCLKVEYLRNANEYLSDANDCSSKSAVDKVTDLENLLGILSSYVSNRDEDCEIFNSQLESKFQEVDSLDAELSQVKEALNMKESELSSLHNLFFDLKQSFSKLTFICQALNNVESQEAFKEVKEKASISILSQPSSLEYEMNVLKNQCIKLDSYIEKNASKIISLSEDLKKVKSDLVVAQKDKLFKGNCVLKNTSAKSVQTSQDLSTDTIEKDQIISELRSERDCLLEQVNYLEDRNKHLKKEIDDIYNSDSERMEVLEKEFTNTWRIRTENLVKDLETKYDRELIDQEAKFAKELHAKVQGVKQENLDQLQKLNAEIVEIKLSHSKELSAIKEQYENQLAVVYSEKDLLKNKLESEYEKKINAFKEKYISKQKEFRSINSQLKACMQHYIEEIEMLKNNNTPSNQLQVIEKLKEKMNEISDERDLFQKQCARANQRISELKDNINHLKHELTKLNEEKNKQSTQGKISKLEEVKKELLYDLDQKKAKIMTLESNNASMLQELKKYKEILSSKAPVSCKCKSNSKELNRDAAEKNEDKKDRKIKMECKSDSDSQEKTTAKQKLTDENATPRQNDYINNQTPDQNAILCVGGGSGPANMVKNYWLEGIVHKKDKEIVKLREEIGDLKSQIKCMKLQPFIKEERQSESKEIKVQKEEVTRSPISPLQEVDENVTIQLKNSHPYPGGTLPKIPRKHTSREKNGGFSNSKPYDKQNVKPVRKENIDWQLPVASNLNKNEPQTKYDVVKQLAEPECKQQ